MRNIERGERTVDDSDWEDEEETKDSENGIRKNHG